MLDKYTRVGPTRCPQNREANPLKKKTLMSLIFFLHSDYSVDTRSLLVYTSKYTSTYRDTWRESDQNV